MGLIDWFDSRCKLGEEIQLKEKITQIVDSYELKENEGTGRSGGVMITFESIFIRLESTASKDLADISLYPSFVKYDGNTIYDYSNDSDKEFLKSLIIILNKKYVKRRKIEEENNKKRIEEAKEREKIKRQLLISEALASITGKEIQKISKKVKDELNPIFDDVRRIQEITKEMTSIKKKYITI